MMTNLHALAAEVQNGRFNQSQKRRLEAAVQAIPDDGFDWAATWGIEEAAAEVFFKQLLDSKNPAALYESMIGESPTRPAIFHARPLVVVTQEMLPFVSIALQWIVPVCFM